MVGAGTLASMSVAFAAAGASPAPPTAAPTPSTVISPGTQVVFQGQASGVTASVPSTGTPPYSWQWFYSTNGGASFAAATTAECAQPSGTGAAAGSSETCSFATGPSTLPGVYTFSLHLTDSATVPESVSSAGSTTVTVERSSTAPGAPRFDTDPQEDCTGGCDGANWFGGTRGSGNLVITTASANELLVLEITDSGQTGTDLSTADLGDTQGSTWTLESTNEWNGFGHFQYVFYALDGTAGSDTVTLDTNAGTHTGTTDATAVLSAFSGVDTGAPIAAKGTFETGTGTQSSASVTTAVSPTTILGIVSTTNGATAFTPTASPAFTEAGTINDGAATASYVEYYAASATGTYTSEPTWTGSEHWGAIAIAIQGASPLSVTVAPTATVLDQGQSVTETATATGGTGALTYTWSIVSGSCPGFTNSGSATLSYSPSGTTTNCVLTVTVEDADSHTAQPTTAASVTVNSALGTPATPTPSATALDVNQAETITGTIPSSGTSTYAWTWLASVNGGAYAAETLCTTNGGTGAAAGATETCAFAANRLTAGDTYTFELRVTDSASTPETTTSAASATVTVSTALVAPAAPSVTATKLDVNQALTATGTIPTTGTASYAWTWLVSVSGGAYGTATQCATNGGTGASAGATETCSVAGGGLVAGDTYAFELQVEDSASAPETATSAASSTVTVNSQLTAPATPTVSATALDVNQAETITGTIPSTGTGGYSWVWLVSVNGGAYADETQCATNGGNGASADATETCALAANALTAGDSYTFELQVTDSATVTESATSAASASISVRTALGAPAAPSVSATKLDLNQALTVTGTVPSSGTSSYGWTWLVSINSGAYATATECAVNSGSGAAAGATETCAVAANSLTAGDTYAFELEVQDSASTPETATSAASSTVTVGTQLAAPAAPSVSASALDVNQAETATGTIPTTGTATYAWTWMVSVNGGAYAAETQCATNGGSGAAAGATETCALAANALTVGDSYAFELKVTDSATTAETATSGASATVTVSSTLLAPPTPSIGAAVIDLNQAETVTGTIPSTGTAPYSWTWLVSIDGGAYAAATVCAVNLGSGAVAAATETCSIASGGLVAGDTYTFELQAKDSATAAETTTSVASSTVTVNSALTAPAAPSVSASKIDLNQAESVSATIPGTGTASYGWTWMVSVNGGAYAAATECATNSGTGATAGASETCSIAAGALTAGDTYAFELKVTDSATTPETATSGASGTVAVASTLTAPAAPTLSAAKLDLNQALTVSGTLPATGTSTYSWQWLVSVNGGAYADSAYCATGSGSGAAAGAGETCSVASGALAAGDSYAFELRVTDSASSAETATSGASASVSVSSALTAPASPSLSATVLDLDQILTVSGTIPSTGTSPYSWQWLVSVNGGAYATATECSVNGGTGATAGATETCAIPGGTLTAGTTLAFELKATDGASSAESATSAASGSLAVNSALLAPGAPVPNATGIDLSQSLSVSGTIPSTGSPSYSWQWLLSVNGGSYGSAAACGSSASGSGAAAGAVETCAIAPETLTGGDNYTFELEVTDSASVAESATSAASEQVAVSSQLVGGSPGPGDQVLDDGQSVVLTADAAGGSGGYTYQWYSGASPGACEALGSPISGATGATFQVWPSSTSYYCYTVEDSDFDHATSGALLLTVDSALTAPSRPIPNASALDANQALTVMGTIPSTGTAPYAWQWMVSIDGAADVAATECAMGSGAGAAGGASETCAINAGALTAGDSYAFELRVTDSSGAGAETEFSAASSSVAVSSPLSAPAAPTTSASTLLLAQTLTISAVLPTTGTAELGWQWLVSVDGGAFENASVCGSSAAGSGGAPGATVQCVVPRGTLAPGNTYAFELGVTDSASAPETATSAASSAVAVALPAIAIGTGQGPVGASYTVAGTGFSASSTVTVTFGGTALAPVSCTDGTFSGTSITTDANGAFACTFRVPSVDAGAYSVIGQDAASASSTVAFSFTVTTPTLTVSPPKGDVGTTVTVNGTGFSVSTTLASLVFDSQTITSCLTGSLTTNSSGAFSCTFRVPNAVSGSNVLATDAGGATASATYSATIPTAAPSALGGWVWYLLVAAVVAVLLLVVLARRRRSPNRPANGPEAGPSDVDVSGGPGSPPVVAIPAEVAPVSAGPSPEAVGTPPMSPAMETGTAPVSLGAASAAAAMAEPTASSDVAPHDPSGSIEPAAADAAEPPVAPASDVSPPPAARDIVRDFLPPEESAPEPIDEVGNAPVEERAPTPPSAPEGPVDDTPIPLAVPAATEASAPVTSEPTPTPMNVESGVEPVPNPEAPPISEPAPPPLAPESTPLDESARPEPPVAEGVSPVTEPSPTYDDAGGQATAPPVPPEIPSPAPEAVAFAPEAAPTAPEASTEPFATPPPTSTSAEVPASTIDAITAVEGNAGPASPLAASDDAFAPTLRPDDESDSAGAETPPTNELESIEPSAPLAADDRVNSETPEPITSLPGSSAPSDTDTGAEPPLGTPDEPAAPLETPSGGSLLPRAPEGADLPPAPEESARPPLPEEVPASPEVPVSNELGTQPAESSPPVPGDSRAEPSPEPEMPAEPMTPAAEESSDRPSLPHVESPAAVAAAVSVLSPGPLAAARLSSFFTFRPASEAPLLPAPPTPPAESSDEVRVSEPDAAPTPTEDVADPSETELGPELAPPLLPTQPLTTTAPPEPSSAPESLPDSVSSIPLAESSVELPPTEDPSGVPVSSELSTPVTQAVLIPAEEPPLPQAGVLVETASLALPSPTRQLAIPGPRSVAPTASLESIRTAPPRSSAPSSDDDVPESAESSPEDGEFDPSTGEPD